MPTFLFKLNKNKAKFYGLLLSEIVNISQLINNLKHKCKKIQLALEEKKLPKKWHFST